MFKNSGTPGSAVLVFDLWASKGRQAITIGGGVSFEVGAAVRAAIGNV
jgi:hypothetical protein